MTKVFSGVVAAVLLAVPATTQADVIDDLRRELIAARTDYFERIADLHKIGVDTFRTQQEIEELTAEFRDCLTYPLPQMGSKFNALEYGRQVSAVVRALQEACEDLAHLQFMRTVRIVELQLILETIAELEAEIEALTGQKGGDGFETELPDTGTSDPFTTAVVPKTTTGDRR